jgi:hypothetical protein
MQVDDADMRAACLQSLDDVDCWSLTGVVDIGLVSGGFFGVQECLLA